MSPIRKKPAAKSKGPGRPKGVGLAMGDLKKHIRTRKNWTAAALVAAAGCSVSSARESLRRYATEGLLRRVTRGQYVRVEA